LKSEISIVLFNTHIELVWAVMPQTVCLNF